MGIIWDAELLGPVMDVFGEGDAGDPSTWPTFCPAGGAAFQLPGAVFDSAYRRVTDLGDGVTETSQHPVLGVRDALFALPDRHQPRQGEQVVIPSVNKRFSIANPEPDGHGHTLLILIEVSS